MIVCEVCGRGPAQENGGVGVSRANAKGVKGIWRCDDHPTPVTQAIHDELSWLTDVIEGK